MQQESEKSTPKQLIEYLENRGWTLMPSEPDIAVLRKSFYGEEEEIVVPIDKKYADYQQRIKDAIRYLAKYEKLSEDQIQEELCYQTWDTLKIRIKGNRIGRGSIPYLDKGIIEEGIRKVLFAAARAVVDTKPYFKRLFSANAEQWMKTCMAGTDELGSYVLVVRMPLQENGDSQKVPFSRKVTEYLMTSLHRLVQMSNGISIARNDLNANLCLGLAEMKPDDSLIDLDFEMKWSSDIPVKENVPDTVSIADRHFSTIAHIGQQLKPQIAIHQDRFIGKVLALQGDADENGEMHGEVIMTLLVDEQPMKAKATLDTRSYADACDAHKQNKYVRVSGILSEKPRCSELQKISEFILLD